jgi:hypothetical protein
MIELTSTERPVAGRAFVAMPFGRKRLAGGARFDFDALFDQVYAPAIRACGMTPQRADRILGTTDGVLDAVWKGIQSAEVVIVDCALGNANVATELVMALTLRKRVVVLAQRDDDIVTNLRGHLRPILYEPTDGGVATMARRLVAQLRTARGEDT